MNYDYIGSNKLYFKTMLATLVYKNMTIYVLAGIVVVIWLVGIPLLNDPKADSLGVIIFFVLVAYLMCRCIYIIYHTLIHPNAFYKGIKSVSIEDDGICFIHETGRFHKVGWKGVVGIRYWNDIVLVDFTALPTFIIYNNSEFKEMIASIVKYKRNA